LKKVGLKPIRECRPPRSGAVKLNGLSVLPTCAEKVKQYAGESGLTVNAVITEVIEKWALRRHQRRRKREMPTLGTEEAAGRNQR
jgi:hypothetical protein